ncbi:MAG: hypothetical protein P8L72_05790 [Flavobacteriaceae bacterium]|jgi:hypothetical protein|nr:hypothetical protein [Flavobacteriaceae bacterium]MDG2314873.1 hypothetical protein [Flavobacteriaceae bacterium]
MIKNISLLMLIVGQLAWAQPKLMSFDKMLSLKSDYLIEKMDLTDTEGAIFKKMYTEQELKIHKFRMETVRAHKKQIQSNLESLTASKAQDYIEEIEANNRTLLKLQEEKTVALQQQFSSIQILLMIQYEERFRKELIRRIRDKKRENKYKD